MNEGLKAVQLHLCIPLGEVPAGYEAQQAARGVVNMGRTHLQIQLQPEQAQTMLRLRQGLRMINAKLEDDKPVVSTPDALRWLLKLIAQAESAGHFAFDGDSDTITFGTQDCDETAAETVEERVEESEEAEESTEETETEPPEPEPHDAPAEAEAIAEYLAEHGLEVTNKRVVEALREQGIVVQSPQVTSVKKSLSS